jgi:thiol-disulfide isomerase/thioredoxin
MCSVQYTRCITNAATRGPGCVAWVVIEWPCHGRCAPCRAVFPHLSEIARKYKDKGLRVVSVCVEQDSCYGAALS